MTTPFVPPTIATASLELRERAKAPTLEFGAGILTERLRAEGSYLLLTQPEPLAVLDPEVVRAAAGVHLVDSLEHDALARITRELPATGTVVGIGGGMAMDSAKFVAWQRGIRLVLVPTIVSVDACVTNTIAVRESGVVTYHGWVVPDLVLVDTAVVAAAPPRLNRAGIGDCVSIRTAIWDWRAGAGHGGMPFVAGIAAGSEAALRRIEGLADQVGAVSHAAVEAIVRTYAEVNALCVTVGHSQPQEGSEHYVAYRLEELTGHSFVHGEVLGLGLVLMATLQGEGAREAMLVLDRARVAWRPADLGLTRAVLREALVGLPDFVRRARLPWSVIDDGRLDPADVEELLSRTPGLWTPD